MRKLLGGRHVELAPARVGIAVPGDVSDPDLETRIKTLDAAWQATAKKVDGCYQSGKVDEETARAFFSDRNAWDIFREEPIAYGTKDKVDDFQRSLSKWQTAFEQSCGMQDVPRVDPPKSSSSWPDINVGVGGASALVAVGVIAGLALVIAARR
jgi:hypothetical protein